MVPDELACRGRDARSRRLPECGAAAEGLEHRVGELISLHWTLAQQLLDDGRQLRLQQRRGMNRRRVIVKDRVQRLDR